MAKTKYDTNVKPNLKKIIGWRRQGLTDLDICKKLKIGKSSFNNYKKKHPELAEALSQGNEELTLQIENRLYKLALDGNINAIFYYLNNYAGRMTKQQEEMLKLKAEHEKEVLEEQKRKTKEAEQIKKKELAIKQNELKLKMSEKGMLHLFEDTEE